MRLTVAAVLLIVASLARPSIAGAQVRPEVVIGSGMVVLPIGEPGMHMSLGLKLRGDRTMAARADVVLEQGENRNLIALGNVIYSPFRGDVAPYLIAGAGMYFDNGTPFAAAGGAGVEFRSRWRVPVFMEARMVNTGNSRVTVTLGIRP